MTATLAELEARVIALAAVNALGRNHREHSERLGDVGSRLGEVESRLGRVESKLDDTNARVRSIEENVAEVKDLLVRSLGNR